MTSICFDIGNTLAKFAIFKNNEIVNFQTLGKDNFSVITNVIDEFAVTQAIVSSVSDLPGALIKTLESKINNVIELTAKTKLPIVNDYETPETLGKDRLAAVVGANYLYPGSNVLVIDAGTAITYDLIDKDAHYLGGNISLGIATRFKALNHFTDRLPLLDVTPKFPMYGRNTADAIRAGVLNGIVFEVDGTIDAFKQLYPDLKVLFTGGDAKFFDNKVKNAIFVHSNLVMTGLYRILTYHAESK